MSNSANAAARKSPNVDASGTDNPLCRLRLPAHLRGEAGDHVQQQVGQPRDEEREEQAVVVEALYKGRILEDASEFRGRGGLQEAWKDRDHTDKHRSYGPPVPAAGVGVAAVELVELDQVELTAAHYPVVRDHDGPDGAEEAPVADQPGEDVGADAVEEHPGKRDDTEDRGDDPPSPERDVPGRQVREVERRGDHVRGHVRRDLGYHDDDHGEDQDHGEIAGEPGYELYRVPDRLAEDDDGRRRHRDADEAEGRH